MVEMPTIKIISTSMVNGSDVVAKNICCIKILINQREILPIKIKTCSLS
jgi:hypothetical protein